jgi:hypothetical protein
MIFLQSSIKEFDICTFGVTKKQPLDNSKGLFIFSAHSTVLNKANLV